MVQDCNHFNVYFQVCVCVCVCVCVTTVHWIKAPTFYNTTPSLFRILHIIPTMLFTYFVLRIVEKRLGWCRTCFIYILSGVGGNIVSAVFVPYYPEVGGLNRKLLYP